MTVREVRAELARIEDQDSLVPMNATLAQWLSGPLEGDQRWAFKNGWTWERETPAKHLPVVIDPVDGIWARCARCGKRYGNERAGTVCWDCEWEYQREGVSQCEN